MMYFCPWGEPACAHKDEAALETALSTLQRQYDVVAVLERLPESLQLLEAVLPRYVVDNKVSNTSVPHIMKCVTRMGS